MTDPQTTNDWCRALGIATPKLEMVKDHPEAITYSLLLIALLERGAPMTLVDVAARFEEAGISEKSRALVSLSRCNPSRPPVYRDGDLYSLDPHDADLDLWVFRLGLRPPKVSVAPPKVIEHSPLPGPDVALTMSELDEAWRGASISTWSSLRVAVAVLDAHGGPMAPADVVAAVVTRAKWHRFNADPATFKRRGRAVVVLPDGRFAIAKDAGETVKQVRDMVRERIVIERRYAPMRFAPEEVKHIIAESDAKRAAHGKALARLSRVLVVGFPPARPEAVALVDVGAQTVATFVGDELALLPSKLAAYDIVGGVDVRALLRALAFEPGDRRLVELSPPQKTMTIDERGRTLKLTTELLVQSSCGINKPFGDPKQLAAFLEKGDLKQLRRRIEADVKSLYAFYEYSRLHRAVRISSGALDEFIPAPWVHRDETWLSDLKRMALASNTPLEVVVGNAPTFGEDWARVRLAYVEKVEDDWNLWLFDEVGRPIDEALVQRARLPVWLH